MSLLPFSRRPVEKLEKLARCFPPLVPLARALLCLDCEGIFVADGSQLCPGCGSATAWALGRALQRDQPPSRSANLSSTLCQTSEAPSVAAQLAM